MPVEALYWTRSTYRAIPSGQDLGAFSWPDLALRQIEPHVYKRMKGKATAEVLALSWPAETHKKGNGPSSLQVNAQQVHCGLSVKCCCTLTAIFEPERPAARKCPSNGSCGSFLSWFRLFPL